VFGRRAFLSMIAASPLVASSVASGDEPSDYEKLVAETCRRIGHPASACGLVVNGKLVAATGRGLRHKYRGGKVDAQTVFRIASITKVFAGIALLQLRDEGKLTLDDPLAKHIPEAALVKYPKDDDKPPITLRHIVTHTSGMPRRCPDAISEASLVAMLKGLRLESTPGTKTSYSNLAAGFVGPLVKKLTGIPFREYMKAKVFDPLGTTSVAWQAKDVEPKRLACGNEKKKEGEKKDEIEPVDTEWRQGAAEAYGGLYASVVDMSKFAIAQLAAYGETDDAVLKRSSIKESHQPQMPDQPTQKHGVFWWLGDDLVWHSGATDEYSASLVLSPKKQAAAIVMSSYADVGWIESNAKRLLKKAAG
jgi:CubicO group peptidase (beta-lactamase class C family)